MVLKMNSRSDICGPIFVSKIVQKKFSSFDGYGFHSALEMGLLAGLGNKRVVDLPHKNLKDGVIRAISC